MVNALAACDDLVIPVQTEFLALKGLERMLHTTEMRSRSRGHSLSYWIVPTMFDRRTQASINSLRAIRNQHQGRVWPGKIPVDTKFRDAPAELACQLMCIWRKVAGFSPTVPCLAICAGNMKCHLPGRRRLNDATDLV